MMFGALGFLLGNCSLAWMSELPAFWVLGVEAGFLLLLLWILQSRAAVQTCLPKHSKVALIFIVSFLTGHLWVSGWAMAAQRQVLPSDLAGKPISVEGRIVGIPIVTDRQAQFEFKIDRVVDAPSQWPHPGKVSLTWYWQTKRHKTLARPPELLPGARHTFTVRLKKPRGFSNPGSFDSEKQAFIQHIVAEGSVVAHKAAALNQRIPLVDAVDRLRLILSTQIQTVVPNSPYIGILQALTLGIRNQVTRDQWDLFQKTGTAHLMAISGLHIGLAAGLCFSLFYFLWSRLVPILWLHRMPAPQIGAIGSIMGAFIYALLSGFSVPTQRAFVMVLCAMLGMLFRRRLTTWQIYSVALIAVLLIDPMATLSIGFWLSFGAVAVILVGMQNRFRPQGLWWKYGRVQWVAFVGLVPLTVYGFKSISFISPMANMIAIPWVSFITVPLALCGVVLAPLLKLASLSLTVLEPILSTLQHSMLGYKTMPTPPSMLPLFCAVIGVLIILLPRGLPGRWFGVFWLLPLCAMQPTKLPYGQAKVTVLDVGQGLSTVIETQNHLLVYDTGTPFGQHSDLGERVILPYLSLDHANQPIDRVIISHVDTDHAGGLPSLVKSKRIQTLMTSEPLVLAERLSRAAAILTSPIVACQANQTWEWDGVLFEMLHPVDANANLKRNNRSCVLRVSAGNQRVLMTGDIESGVERRLLRASVRDKLKASVLIVPHHGSKTSSSYPFIEHVNPQYAIVSAGYLNRYGHPKKHIVQRYEALGIHWLNTTKSGAISFLLRPITETLENPSEYRVQHRKVWLSFID